MAQLKVYSFRPHYVYDERTKNILSESRTQLRCVIFVGAYSKDAAVEFVSKKLGNTPNPSELRLAQGNDYDALREATLFAEEGVVVVTRDTGGKRPVVLAQADTDEGSQAIGIIRPADGRAGQVFEATAARFAGRGSIAVGAEVAYVKVLVTSERSYWEGTKGDTLDDDQIQLKIDRGELNIIRSGFGDWFHAGR